MGAGENEEFQGREPQRQHQPHRDRAEEHCAAGAKDGQRRRRRRRRNAGRGWTPREGLLPREGHDVSRDRRYTYERTLGVGAYGVVCSASDEKEKRRVAIKKVGALFDDLTDAKRILREIRLISSMKHENILKIVDIDEPENYAQFNDIYLVTELMDTDLNKLLRSKHVLLEAQRRFFTYQILRAMKYIHRYVFFSSFLYFLYSRIFPLLPSFNFTRRGPTEADFTLLV